MSWNNSCNMSESTGDRLMRQLCNQNGYNFINSQLDPRAGPSIVAVPYSGGINLNNTWNGEVYQQCGGFPGFPVYNNAPNFSSSSMIDNWKWSWPPSSTNPSRPLNNANYQAPNQSVRSGIILNPSGSQNCGFANSVSVNPSRDSSWSSPAPTKQQNPYRVASSNWPTANVRQGLRVIPASDMIMVDVPESPSSIDADSLFNDSLYMSLQDDLLPTGGNPLDDYLNKHGDCRARIYLDATVGNQGCCCEHDKTSLDKYLNKHKKVMSAISLRATLSEDSKKHVQEPTVLKPMQDRFQAIEGQIHNMLKMMREYSGQSVESQVSPWNAYRGDDNMNID